jgi:tRNA dimethylallyltransferase
MDWPREELYSRINKRVDNMVARPDWKKKQETLLLAFAHLQTLNTVGYKEWFAHFNGRANQEKKLFLIDQAKHTQIC